MATVALVLAALLVVSTVVLLVVAARRRPGGIVLGGAAGAGRPRATGAGHPVGRSSLDRLAVGAEVAYDDREWVVIGVQRFAARDGVAAWCAWHLDLKGQPGWMAVADDDREHLVFAVGAEKPETIDPASDPVVWRDVSWTRIDEAGDGVEPGEGAGPTEGVRPVAVEGQRRRNRQPREELTDDAVQRVTFTRDDLPRRRLILERRVGDERWAAWIGDRVPAAMVHVTRWPTR